jgi:hypothetical protein
MTVVGQRAPAVSAPRADLRHDLACPGHPRRRYGYNVAQLSMGAVLRTPIRSVQWPNRVDDRDKPGHDSCEAASANSVCSHAPTAVMTGLVPVIHAVGLDETLQSYRWVRRRGLLFDRCSGRIAWMTGTSPVMTEVGQWRPHGEDSPLTPPSSAPPETAPCRSSCGHRPPALSPAGIPRSSRRSHGAG